MSAVVHDLFDGSAHCVECGGPCQLTGAERHLSNLVRYLIEVHVIDVEVHAGSGCLNMMLRGELEAMGVDVEKAKARALSTDMIRLLKQDWNVRTLTPRTLSAIDPGRS